MVGNRPPSGGVTLCRVYGYAVKRGLDALTYRCPDNGQTLFLDASALRNAGTGGLGPFARMLQLQLFGVVLPWPDHVHLEVVPAEVV